MAHKRAGLHTITWCVVTIAILGAGESPSQQPAKPSPASKAANSAPHGTAPPATGASVLNPFDRYLAAAKAHRTEPALDRFAKTCGVNVAKVKAGYAERSAERWRLVKSFTHVPKSQGTDSYETLALWQAGPRIVTEEWGFQTDSGEYYRTFTCLLGRRITAAESVIWDVEEDSPGWGYEVRWELGVGGKFARASTRFLDLSERPIAEPKLDEDTKEDLNEQDYEMHTWVDLEYPAALLQWNGG
jgi:hypothetical protein